MFPLSCYNKRVARACHESKGRQLWKYRMEPINSISHRVMSLDTAAAANILWSWFSMTLFKGAQLLHPSTTVLTSFSKLMALLGFHIPIIPKVWIKAPTSDTVMRHVQIIWGVPTAWPSFLLTRTIGADFIHIWFNILVYSMPVCISVSQRIHKVYKRVL